MMWNFGNSAMGWGFGPFSWIFMILQWAVIIAVLVFLVKWFTNHSRGSEENGQPSLEILKERYARGEINKQEFEEKKKDLQ